MFGEDGDGIIHGLEGRGEGEEGLELGCAEEGEVLETAFGAGAVEGGFGEGVGKEAAEFSLLQTSV